MFHLLLLSILLVHLGWIVFVLFGALLTRGRPGWTAVHLLALLWGVIVEVGPWPCPLTIAELHADALAGVPPYGGGYLAHMLDALIYPNLPDRAITVLGVSVCAFNLGVYAWRAWQWYRDRERRKAALN